MVPQVKIEIPNADDGGASNITINSTDNSSMG